MNCDQAQDAILQSDDPNALEGDLARHVATCAACQAIALRLGRIERAAAQLPAPAMAQAKRRTLEKHSEKPLRRLILRPTWITAAAAMLIVGIGLASLFWPGESAPTVVERLVDWDLDRDQATPEQRQKYASMAPAMQNDLRAAALNESDKKIAAKLLEEVATSSQATADADPVDRAEHFCDLADLLVGRIDSAAAANDAAAVQRLGTKLNRVQKGLGAHLERLHATAYVGPNAKRLEKIAKRQAESEKRLAAMAEKAPKASQKALKRMLENNRKRVI